MKLQGRIVEWRDDRGFGFIAPLAGGEKVFLHIKAFAAPTRRPVGGEQVAYRLAKDENGRPRAERVEYVGGERHARRPASLPLAVIGSCFPAALFALVAADRLPWFVPAVCMALSLIAYGMYALDKSAARRGAWRTQESTLHLLSLAGGWPGALVAQHRLRHKTRKISFLAVFWLTVAANLAAVAWLLSKDGTRLLAMLLSDG